MHFQWEYAWLGVCHIISQQWCEIERWFQRTTYRKLCIRSPMVTWQTSRDPKRSRSWPQYLWSLTSQKPCETDCWFKLTTYRKPILRVQWSRGRWCHVTPKGEGRDQNIFETSVRQTVASNWPHIANDISWNLWSCDRWCHLSPMVTV